MTTKKRLCKLFRKDTHDLKVELSEYADMVGENFLLFTPNKLKYNICLVAHLDTHFDTDNRENMDIYFDSGKKVLWSPQGLGADNRAGIYACMEIYKSFPRDKRPLMLFTDGEESGGVGASEAIKMCGGFFKEHVGFFLQLDRMGNKEAVFYSGESDEFINYITTFGFEEKIGTFSDVAIISPAIGVASTNISIGYYNEHTHHEFLKLDNMQYSINKGIQIVTEYDHKTQYEVPIIQHYGIETYQPAVYAMEKDTPAHYCHSCQSWFAEELTVDGTICPLCHSECGDESKIESRWCPKCRDWFIVDDNFRGKHGEIYCPFCEYDVMEFGYIDPKDTHISPLEIGGDGI